jgi:FKBP-type peptidyl-prolyl cis-trans isomerase 2
MTVAAKAGDTVFVDYAGKLQNGTLFDTSLKDEAAKAGLPPRPTYEPLSFVVGVGSVIKGFDAAVIGMKVGDEKNVTLPPDQAYGESTPNLVMNANTSEIKDALGSMPKVGMELSAGGAPGIVISVNDTITKIDFNSPLAGKTLVFRIIMRRVVPKAG